MREINDEPLHHRDADEPCEGCGAEWEGADDVGYRLDHKVDCPWIETIEGGDDE